MTYKYNIVEASKPIASLEIDPVSGNPNTVNFVLETMNEFGSRGIRVLAPPIPSTRKSSVAGPTGEALVDYCLLIFTEEVVVDEEAPF